MGIQSFTPSGGGGTPGFDYIGSVRMETYNRSWTQAGAAGNYVVTSNNNNSGYVYFVTTGGTVGTPLGQVINLTSPFTRLDIVAPTNDFISLYKVSVKSTSVFNNALAGFSAFPSIMSASGNFVLPNASLPLVDVMLVGAGGSAHGHGSGGGGGGVVKLTAYQAVGTTSVTVGANAGSSTNVVGGSSYFGNVYAMGGGGGFASRTQSIAQTHGNGANGAGASHGGTGDGGTGGGIAGIPGTTQTAGTGLNTKGSPTYTGGHRGGNLGGGFTPNHGGAGGGGGGGVGGDRNGTSGTAYGGLGHVSNFSGSNIVYSAGGGGSHHSGPASDGSYAGHSDAAGYGWGRNSNSGDTSQSGNGNGVVMVRYYIP